MTPIYNLIALLAISLNLIGAPAGIRLSPDCLPNHLYLPLVRNEAMLITRFGDTYDTAQQFSVGLSSDDWQSQRASVVKKIPQVGGVYDYWAVQNSPLEALTIKKSFAITDPSTIVWSTGTGTIFTHIDTYPDGIKGINTHFTTDFSVGDCIRFTYAGTTYTYPIASIVNDGDMRLLPADTASLPLFIFSGAVGYQIGKINPAVNASARLEALKKSVLGDESKLWADVRDGSHRWAWAKCTKFSAPETIETLWQIPVDLEFYLREGLWHGETLRQSGSYATSDTCGLLQAGNFPAAVKTTVHAGSTAITDVEVGHYPTVAWQYTGTIAAGKSLVVDAELWSVENDGVGDYKNLNIIHPDSLGRWLTVDGNPVGYSSILVSRTGGGAGAYIQFEYYDTWI